MSCVDLRGSWYPGAAEQRIFETGANAAGPSRALPDNQFNVGPEIPSHGVSLEMALSIRNHGQSIGATGLSAIPEEAVESASEQHGLLEIEHFDFAELFAAESDLANFSQQYEAGDNADLDALFSQIEVPSNDLIILASDTTEPVPEVAFSQGLVPSIDDGASAGSSSVVPTVIPAVTPVEISAELPVDVPAEVGNLSAPVRTYNAAFQNYGDSSNSEASPAQIGPIVESPYFWGPEEAMQHFDSLTAGRRTSYPLDADGRPHHEAPYDRKRRFSEGVYHPQKRQNVNMTSNYSNISRAPVQNGFANTFPPQPQNHHAQVNNMHGTPDFLGGPSQGFPSMQNAGGPVAQSSFQAPPQCPSGGFGYGPQMMSGPTSAFNPYVHPARPPPPQYQARQNQIPQSPLDFSFQTGQGGSMIPAPITPRFGGFQPGFGVGTPRNMPYGLPQYPFPQHAYTGSVMPQLVHQPPLQFVDETEQVCEEQSKRNRAKRQNKT